MSISSKARRCSRRPASTIGSYRSAHNAAARRIWWRRATRIIKEGKLGKIAYVEICCYYHMRARENPPDTAPPENLDYEMWTGPAPMRPYNKLVHPRSWRAFNEYGNGIVGDMCIHMYDMVRWMMDLGCRSRVIIHRRHSGGQEEQGKYHRHTDSDVRSSGSQDCWTHRTWGTAPDPRIPGRPSSTATRER